MAETKERSLMTKFWMDISQAEDSQTKDTMMLTTNCESLDELEVPELLALLPDYENKDVLEVGAGIGRFTPVFAKDAHHIRAVDFVQKFVDKNIEDNRHMKNIDFQCADITKTDYEKNSYDLIFTNWLLMYLGDDEVVQVATNMLRWLRDGGSLFVRESCFHPSGNVKPSDLNPTKYRTPARYNEILRSITIPDEEGTGSYSFNVILCRSVQAYIKIKNNPNQRCWLLQKTHHTKSEMLGYRSFQEFLDAQQYSRHSILRYERIFGEHFVSTGGLDTTKEFVSMLDLKSRQRVLDVGCGIGGSGFYMAKEYDVDVVGIDLSTNMIDIAMEKSNDIKDTRVQFEVGDATKRDFPPESFDVIYSRDTILHIADKNALFSNFYKWLKPGGKVMITDYCCGERPHTPEFEKYVQQRGYNLLTPAEYGKIFESVGFNPVLAEDRTEQFIKVLKEELVRIKSIKEEMIRDFSEEDYTYLIDGWEQKVVRCNQGDQRWGMFRAQKPATATTTS